MKPVAHPDAGKVDQYVAERQPVRPEPVPAGSPNAGSNVPDSLHAQSPFQRQDATRRRLIPVAQPAPGEEFTESPDGAE